MVRLYWLCTLIFCPWLTACALLESRPADMTLPLASPLPPSRHILQRVEAQWSDNTTTFLCALELSAQHIAMAGVTPEGITLFNLTFDGQTVRQQKSPLLPEMINPQMMISDLQLSYWPADALQKVLPRDWRLESNAEGRTLYVSGIKRSEVHYGGRATPWPDSVELTNHRYHYRLRMTTLSYDVLPE